MFSDINKQIQIYSDSLLRALNRHVYFVCKQEVSSTLSPGVQCYKHHTSLLWLHTLRIEPTGHRMVERLREDPHLNSASNQILCSISMCSLAIRSAWWMTGNRETAAFQL